MQVTETNILEVLIKFQGWPLTRFEQEIRTVFGDSVDAAVIAGLHNRIKAIQPQEPTPEEVDEMIGGIYPVFLRPFMESLAPAESWLLSEYFDAIRVYDFYFPNRQDRDNALDWLLDKSRKDPLFRSWLLTEMEKPFETRQHKPIPWDLFEPTTPEELEEAAYQQQTALQPERNRA